MEEMRTINSIMMRALEILSVGAEAIKNIPLDDSLHEAMGLMLTCSGKVITTGMGKAGLVARKFAATLCSTGTSACFLHPGEAQHGDLGILSENDVLVVLSTSGRTREVLELVHLAKSMHDSLKMIVVTSKPESELSIFADVVLSIGTITEPDILKLVPSASTTAMLALCDTLALLLMEEREFTKEDFGLRHHGGYIGQKCRGEDEDAAEIV